MEDSREGIASGTDLASVLRHLGVIVFRRAADSTLRFLEVDGHCAERMGLSSSALTGDAYSFWTCVDPADRRRVLAVLEESIDKGCDYRVAYRLHSPSGPTHSVREEGAPEYDANGDIVALRGVILEARAELGDADSEELVARLEESRERFLALARHSGEMIAEISADGRLSFLSPRACALLGRTAEELEGSSAFSLVHPDDRGHVRESAHQVLRTGDAGEVLCRLARADGSWLWVEISGHPLDGGDGERRAIVMGRDVEDRVRVEETLVAQGLAEARIGKLTRRFMELGQDELDDAIYEGLEAAGEIGGADRSYLLAFRSRRIEDTQVYHWQRDGLESWSPLLDSTPDRRFAWMREALKAGEVIRVPRVREMPEEQSAAREDLLGRGIQSLCVIPVRSQGRMEAVLGFQSIDAERDWSEQEIALLRLIAELFASALQRREVQGALRDSEQRLRAITDGAQDAICENELAHGEVLYANPRFYEIHGYTAEEAAGMSSFDFMHPEDLELIRQAHRAFERGDLGDANSGTLLYRGLCKGGGIRWLEANGRLFWNAQGQARSAAVIRDVTEREAAQQALERRLSDQMRIANLARDLLALDLEEIDAGVMDGIVSLLPISQADRTWLVTGDPASEAPVWEWCAEGVLAPAVGMREVSLDALPQAAALFRRGQVLTLPNASLHETSEEVRFLASRGATSLLAIPLLSRADVVGVIGFERLGELRAWSPETIALLRLAGEVLVSAISRQRAEKALRESRGQLLQAQKMEAVGTLAGGIAHDFNNQLSVILGNARWVRGEVEQDEDLGEAMQDLERAGEHCAQLTRSLLSFSRYVPAEPCATSVAKVLREIEQLTGPMISGSIEFETSVHDEFDTVLVDRTQLQQVLVNLVVNASDAMPDGGNLSIRTQRVWVDEDEAGRLGVPAAGEYLEFTVADTGFGMSAETLGRIFEPFFTTKPQGKGTGLGLATAYGILKESNGAIWAESEMGIGTTFRLLLPVAEDPGEEADAERDGGETLLLVEDDASVRRLLHRMLTTMAFHVLEAADGEEALRVSADYAGEIDALVSDVSMPGMTGVELGRRLLEARPGMRVLLVSGDAHDDVALPGAGLLCKPFRREELARALEALLSGKSVSGKLLPGKTNRAKGVGR